MTTNKGLEAIQEYKRVICPNCQYYYGGKCNSEDECFSTVIEKELKDFSRVKDAIEWRIKSYKKELETGCDCDGEKLTETNKLIILNLFNLLTAIESCYKEETL